MISPLKTYIVKQSSAHVYGAKTDMARAAAAKAAKLIRDAISIKRHVRIIVATGNSQLDFISFLTKETGIDWLLVDVFHMDEYVGLPSSHPASFANCLKTHLSDAVRPGQVQYLVSP